MKHTVKRAIEPVHHSLKGLRTTPYSMGRAKMDRKHYEAMVNIAVSIFTDCTNVGVSFQDSLLAIYLSGLHHGAALTKEKTNE